MKKVLMLAFSCLVCTSAMSQNMSFTDVVAYYNLIERSLVINYKTADGQKSSSKRVFASLLRKDVVGYYGLWRQYDTDLKRKVFSESAEYRELNNKLTADYADVMSQTYYFLAGNLNGDYNLSDKSFSFEWWANDIYYSSFPGYIVFNGLCLTYPKAFNSGTTYRDYGNRGGRYIQTFRVPVANERLALEIENDRNDIALMFVFDMQRTERSKTAMFTEDFILGKTKELYLVNTKTGRLYLKLEVVGSSMRVAELPKKVFMTGNRYNMTSEEYYGCEQWQVSPMPDKWIVRCPICNELYNQSGADDLTEDEKVEYWVHWAHEEEALIKELFGEDSARKYREGNWTWDFDEEWLRNSEFGETEWLSVTGIRNAWKEFQKWKAEQELAKEVVPVLKVEVPPSFMGGGVDEFRKWLFSNLSYPKKSTASGRVIVEFAVDETGKVTDIVIKGSLDKYCDEEVVRAINSSPAWTPGNNGKVKFLIPIDFQKPREESSQKKR